MFVKTDGRCAALPENCPEDGGIHKPDVVPLFTDAKAANQLLCLRPEDESMEKAVNRKKLYDLAVIPLFSAAIAVCAWITVPIPAVPFTLQIFGIFLGLFTLGGKRGTLALLVYLVLGAAGLPVFSSFRGGLSVLLGTTGGYLLGFVPMALLVWAAEPFFAGKSFWRRALVCAAAVAVCYAFGTAWFLVVYTQNTGAIGVWTVLLKCVFPFLLPDAVKIFLAARLAALFRRLGLPRV